MIHFLWALQNYMEAQHLNIIDISKFVQPESLSDQVTNNDSDSETPAAKGSVSESAFISLLFAIIISWILVALWTRTVENFAFGTLGLNGDSTVDSLIVASAISVIFFFLVWTLDQYDIIIGGLERVIASETLIPAP